MYLITKSTVGGIIDSIEVWCDWTRAEIRRNVINKNCSELEGAFVHELLVEDLDSVVIKPLYVDKTEKAVDQTTIHYLKFSDNAVLILFTKELEGEVKILRCMYDDSFTNEEATFHPSPDLSKQLLQII